MIVTSLLQAYDKLQNTNQFKEETMTILHDGTKEWRLNGRLHRINGPAVEYPSGNKFYYKNGKLHRDDGPAIELIDGSKFWYLNDKRIHKCEINP